MIQAPGDVQGLGIFRFWTGPLSMCGLWKETLYLCIGVLPAYSPLSLQHLAQHLALGRWMNK